MRRCTTVAKKELLFAGPFGLTAWLCGTTFIDRKKAVEARSLLANLVEERSRQGISVLLFPEGTR